MSGKESMNENKFKAQFESATARGKKILSNLPKARTAKYDSAARRIVLDLENGATLLVPIDLIQGLQNQTDKELDEVRLLLKGSQIHWPKLDVQMYVKSLIDGVFGTPNWMSNLKDHYAVIGAKGGISRSAAKSSASRLNGKKGGRPRKPVAA